MDAGAAGAFAAAVGVPLALALLRRLAPARPPAPKHAPPLEELRRRYQKWEVASIVPGFAFAGALGYAWYRLLLLLAPWSQGRPGADELLVAPSAAFWALPALFLGIVSSALPTDLLYRRLLGGRYAEFELYGRMKHGFDGRRVFRVLAVVVGLGALAFTALGLDCYTRFTPTEVVVNPLLGLGETRRPYTDVVAVLAVSGFRAPNGNVVERLHFVVQFRDGSRWTTRDGGRDPEPADAQIAEYVAARSGVPVRAVPMLE